MANLIKDRPTMKDATVTHEPVLVANANAATVYHIGLLQTISATGFAQNPDVADVALVPGNAGVVKAFVDNSLGAAAAMRVELETGIFYFDYHGVHPPVLADVGKPAYATDNHTISNTAADGPYVGRIVKIETGQVGVAIGPRYVVS